MSYLVLARKWRPKQFDEVVAQQHVIQTITNAIEQKRIASAYLFSGPRGVGKTTMARLLAKAVNCQKGPTPSPCDECTNCVEIAGGRSLDVIEIDGASNRGIDEVRNLREGARFAPTTSVKKIYIIDEVHMLTDAAFNALLKIIEEPPAHILFIFATTEIHKVPATILSRCQRFDFRRVPLQDIVGQLNMICQNEGVQTDEASLYIIAKRAEGSMRDSQSLLDQVISFCGNRIMKEEVIKLFGLLEQDLFFECTDIAIKKDFRQAVALCERIHSAGVHLGEFFERLAEHLSHILTSRLTNSAAHLVGLESYAERYRNTAAALGEIEVLQHLQIATEAQTKLARTSNPRLLLEMTLLKMAALGMPKPQAAMNSTGGATPAPTPSASAEAKPAIATAHPVKVDGVVLVPQVEPKTASAYETAQNNLSQAKPAGLGLFASGILAKVQEVPVVKAKEANLPLNAQISDVKAALRAIQNHWAKIVEQVKGKRISLGAFLEEGFPCAITDGTLEVGFTEASDFHLNTVNNQKTLIQQIIQHETGYSIRMHCRKDDRVATARQAVTVVDFEPPVTEDVPMMANLPAEAVDLPAPPIMVVKKEPTYTVQELFQNFPMVQKFVEAVDGEFLRCVRP